MHQFRLLSLCLLVAHASAITMSASRTLSQDSPTLRQWLSKSKCFSIANQPLMNTQSMFLGAYNALNDQGLLNTSKITSLSGVSASAFSAAMLATGEIKERTERYKKTWPGWSSFAKKTGTDPEMTENYMKYLKENDILPVNFADLKIPLAVGAVKYEDEKAASGPDWERAEPVVISDGDLLEAISVSSSAMMGAGCPNCKQGFKAKEFRGMWPVADGFIVDEFGTLGLAAHPHCNHVLHIVPANFKGQKKLVPGPEELDTEPFDVTTLLIHAPSSSVMSMLWDGFREKVGTLGGKLATNMLPPTQSLLGKFANDDDTWDQATYEGGYKAIMQLLDQPMELHQKNHYVAEAETPESWTSIRTPAEEKFDKKNDGAHGDYWVKTAERRASLVKARQEKFKKGTLSYKKGGNGLGAPKK